MVSSLMQLDVVTDAAVEQTVYLDVDGPVLLSPAGDARPRCTMLRTQVGEVCVKMPPAELRRKIHEHRGVR